MNYYFYLFFLLSFESFEWKWLFVESNNPPYHCGCCCFCCCKSHLNSHSKSSSITTLSVRLSVISKNSTNLTDARIYGLHRTNEGKKTQATIYFSVSFCLSMAITIMFARFSRFSPLTATAFEWAVSHCACIVSASFCAIRTSESFFFVALMLFADVFSCLKIYYTKHHQISWSCLLSIVPFSLACVIRILIMNKKNDRPLLAADKCDKHF